MSDEQHQDGAAAAAEHHPANPVPVRHHGTLDTLAQGAEYGGWMTYAVGPTITAQPILPYDRHRARALLVVSGTGPVYVGSQAQTQASPVQGGALPAGTYELKNKQPLWLASDGTHTATVAVLAERYAGS